MTSSLSGLLLVSVVVLVLFIATLLATASLGLSFNLRDFLIALGRISTNLSTGSNSVRATLMTKPQPKGTQGDKGRYENNVQPVQWIASVYTSANDKYMETCLVQWISSEIKLRRSHHTGRNPKPYAGAYYIIITTKGKGNINKNPDKFPIGIEFFVSFD